jgi:hypothetical protein
MRLGVLDEKNGVKGEEYCMEAGKKLNRCFIRVV